MEDLSGDVEAVVVLHRGYNVGRKLVLRDPVHPAPIQPNSLERLNPFRSVRCVVDVYDSELEAHVTFDTVDEDDGLAEFLRGLAADFRGRAGSRHWSSNYDELQVDAIYDRPGQVTLLIRLRHEPEPWEGYWDLSLPFTVEAGAEMLALADAVESFFAPPPGHKIPNKA